MVTGYTQFTLARLAYVVDGRVPVEALESGAEAIYKVLRRFGE